MTKNQTIIRTRNQQRAIDLARKMAGSLGRTFVVTRCQKNLWAVSPQRMDLSLAVLRGYRNVATAIIRLEEQN